MGMTELNAVRRGFDLFQRQRQDVIYANLPDSFGMRDNVILEAFEAKGRDAMKRNLESIGEAFADTSWQPLEYRDLGTRIAVRVHFEGTGRESGVKVTRDVGQLWTFKDGQAVHFEVFPTLDEALEAAKG